MEFTKLTDVCDFQGGSQPPKNEWINNEADGYIRMLQIRDFTQDREEKEFVKITNTIKTCKKDDVLIARYGASVGKILTGLEGAYNVAIMKSIPNENKIKKRYLYYYFKTQYFQHNIRNVGSRAAQAGFNISELDKFDIYVAELDKQKKIVEVLDKAQSLIDKKKEQIDLLDELIKSRFVEMFGDPVLNTKGWEIKKVIDVCDCMVPGRDKPKSFTGNTPWITIDDLKINGVTYKSKSGLGLTDYEIKEVKRKKIPKNSVLMSCVGNLGICSIAGEDMIINQQLHSFQCKEINNYFLMYYLGFRKDYMESKASSTTVLYMNKTVCNSIPVYLPPIELQNEFAEFVTQTDSIRSKMEASLTELEDNFNSLMQKAFKGELFV